MRFIYIFFLSFIVLMAFHSSVSAETANATLADKQGNTVGLIKLTEIPHGVLIKAELYNMPPGVHAFHIHSTGKCEPPFKSAGGHFNPRGKVHGILNKKGPHAGDLPNIYVGDDGKLTFEVIADKVTLGKGKNSLHDDDGSALLIHAGPDDYTSDPAGNAGPRIACGVIK